MPKSNGGNIKKFKKYTGKSIYMDYSASVSPNPGSVHAMGVKAKEELRSARAIVASILKARTDEIIFTSGGTESNNLAIQGVILSWYDRYANGKKIPHIITTNIEHPSVLKTFEMMRKRGLVSVSIISVEKNGLIDPKKIGQEINENTILISVMYANNEIGTVQPVKEIAREIRRFKKNFTKALPSFYEGKAFVRQDYPVFHTDAVQAANYLDLNVETLGVDLLSLSGSKIENSGRVGMLYKKRNISLVSILGGGDQEFGLRPGTENLSEILKFAAALKNADSIKSKEVKRLVSLRNYFIKKLPHGAIINGDIKERLPNNVNVSFSNIPGDLLVVELSEQGIMASAKSACESGDGKGSYVINAIHPEENLKNGGLRFSMGKMTKKSDIDRTVLALAGILKKLSKWYN